MSISTSYISGYSSFVSSNLQFKHNRKLKYRGLLCVHGSKTIRSRVSISVVHRERMASLTTKVMEDSLILADTSPAKSGDITVFLQTSAVLLFMYWISNFVVPDLISKYFEFDKVYEEQKTNKKGKKKTQSSTADCCRQEACNQVALPDIAS